MSTVLSLAGFALLVIGGIGVVKGGVRRVGLNGRKQSAWAVAAAFGVLAVGGSMAPPSAPAAHETPAAVAPSRPTHQPEVVAAPSPSPSSSEAEVAVQSVASPAVSPARSAVPATSSLGPLLLMASGGDGDSWRDTRGVEYRLGLVNAPEVGECGGSAATAYRKRALRAGFYARSYTTDTYGRRVSVVYTRAGTNLNVAMARDGIANDRYLAEFRDENPSLAQQLDGAFAQAKARHAGVWGSCSASSPAARPQSFAGSGGSCHPDYKTCVPVKGDGSGRGAANDLDCGDIRQVVYLRTVGRDPYRLDSNDDGVGCESYG